MRTKIMTFLLGIPRKLIAFTRL